jgi:hypothetical protein
VEHRFAPRDQVWAPRGRKPKPVPQDVLMRLSMTHATGEVWVVTLGPDDGPDEVAELVALLRAGARQLGGRLRAQKDLEAGEIRFELWGVAS